MLRNLMWDYTWCTHGLSIRLRWIKPHKKSHSLGEEIERVVAHSTLSSIAYAYLLQWKACNIDSHWPIQFYMWRSTFHMSGHNSHQKYLALLECFHTHTPELTHISTPPLKRGVPQLTHYIVSFNTPPQTYNVCSHIIIVWLLVLDTCF